MFWRLRWILPLAVVALEFSWAYPWVLLFSGTFYGPSAPPLLPAGSALALLALGCVVVRAAGARPWPLRATRTVVVAAGAVAGMTAVKLTYYRGTAPWDIRWVGALLVAAHDALPSVTPAVMGALTATVLWWRGIVLGEREFGHFEVDRAFRRGIAWSVIFVLLLALYGDTAGFALTRPAPAYLLAFFSIGLVTLALTRLLALWEETHADPTQALAANRHWLLILVGVVGAILVSAGALAAAVHVQMRPVLLRLLRPLAPVAEFVFYALFAVAMVVARVIVYVLSRLPIRGIAAPAPQPAGSVPLSLRDFLKDLPPHVVSGARWGAVLLVVTALVVVVALSVVRARRKAKKASDDERESVWSGEAMLSGLGAAWRRLWSRLRPEPAARDAPAVASIRAIYCELLRTGRQIGTPRKPAETPYEYRPRLSASLPQVASEVSALTEAYVRVRYTPAAPSGDEVRGAQEALERIRNSFTEPGEGEPA